MVPVVDVAEHHLELRRLTTVPPTIEAAHAFGAALARTHGAGAAGWGAAPAGWSGHGFFGPLSDPLPMPLGGWPTWGSFYAEARIAPMVRLARDRGVYDGVETRPFDDLCVRLAGGELDTDDEPARIHGDLWSGNVMWTADGATLIDPAAHGGHRETDLALLALFGAPFLDHVLAGYQTVHPLADGWPGRVRVHQLHCLLVHAILFGGGYADRALAVARGR